MQIVESLKREFAPARPAFECRLCAATFDREPPNCPTCGSTEIGEN